MQGHRVLGVSYGTGEGPRFGGFISFADTLKPSAIKTPQQAKELNVAVTIIIEQQEVSKEKGPAYSLG